MTLPSLLVIGITVNEVKQAMMEEEERVRIRDLVTTAAAHERTALGFIVFGLELEKLQ